MAPGVGGPHDEGVETTNAPADFDRFVCRDSCARWVYEGSAQSVADIVTEYESPDFNHGYNGHPDRDTTVKITVTEYALDEDGDEDEVEHAVARVVVKADPSNW